MISPSAIQPLRASTLPARGRHARLQPPRWKRVLDIVCILLASPLLIPLSLFLALVIKLISPGPALFKQERIGFRGRRFVCLKFRTMVVNADTRVHETHLQHLMMSGRPMEKLEIGGDARIIRGARTLRMMGLDELPQVLNILRGEMSLVGPRPCLPYEYEHYEPRHRHRFDTLPGLTGLWQVNGKNRTTFEEMMALDLHYVDHASPLLDLKIIASTVPAIAAQTWEAKFKRNGHSRPLVLRAAQPGRSLDRQS